MVRNHQGANQAGRLLSKAIVVRRGFPILLAGFFSDFHSKNTRFYKKPLDGYIKSPSAVLPTRTEMPGHRE